MTAELVRYAEHEAQLGKRQGDGATLRQHLEKVKEQTGKTPAQLDPVEIPDAARYLWVYFCELSGGRQYSEVGPMALTYSEIKAWCDLMKVEPTAFEVETIKEIDRAYITEIMKK